MADEYGRDYGEWMEDLMKNPTSGGAKGCFFYIVILPVMILCGVLGLTIFPEGRYPVILLFLPGLVLGMIVLAIFGYIVYRLPDFLAVPLCLGTAAVGFFLLYIYGRVLWGMLTGAL